MRRVGFEPPPPNLVFVRAKIVHDLDRGATVMGNFTSQDPKIYWGVAENGFLHPWRTKPVYLCLSHLSYSTFLYFEPVFLRPKFVFLALN
jgi:hypothetical protein